MSVQLHQGHRFHDRRLYELLLGIRGTSKKIFDVVQKSGIVDHTDRNSKIRTARNVQLHQGHRFHDRRLYDSL